MEEEYDLLSSKEKKELLSKVNKLKKKEHLQIFKIIQDTDISYSENSNGIFINLNNVTETVLKEIKEFVDICYKNNIEYDERKKQMEKLCEEFEQSNSTKNVETLVKNEEMERESKYNKEIKNNKKLSSLEKAIVRNSVNKDINQPENKQNLREFNKKLPKYTGSRARILKTCKELNKSICYTQTVTKPNDEFANTLQQTIEQEKSDTQIEHLTNDTRNDDDDDNGSDNDNDNDNEHLTI